MIFLLLISVFISPFQPISCMQLTQQGGPLTLAPRPKNSAKFLQSLAQLHQEFQISQKPSPQKLLEQIAQQRKMFEIEISQQRHEIRENHAQISEKRARLKDILTQFQEEYTSIKVKNQKILDQIVSQEDLVKIKIVTTRIAEKIKNNNYITSRADDSLESFKILYERYNVKSGEENTLKKKFEEDCITKDKDQQISVLRNGFIGHYDQLRNSIEIILMDFSNPKSQWKSEKRKREAIHQDMRETFAAIQNIEKNIALMKSQAEERDTKITLLMLKEQQLLNPVDTQTAQDHAAQEFDKMMAENLKQNFDQYISNICGTKF